MEVFLMSDVKDVGREGDVVQVADGFARNYLFPQKLAERVTKAARARLQKQQKERDVKRAEERARLQVLADRLAGVSCTIAVKTADGEKLYGSVTAVEIADNLKGQGIEMDRAAIELEAPIKALGVYTVSVRLAPDLVASLKVWVVEE
jgi:large subunit ribosomal protein L9